jgi:hypothetical protein
MHRNSEIVRLRWRAFLGLTGLLVLVAIAVTSRTLAEEHAEWRTILVSILWGWLIVALPIAVLYLAGRPPVMTLYRLVSTAESRAFRRELKTRPVLSEEEFSNRFYAGSGIPRDVAVGVRRCLSWFDPLALRLVPSDFLGPLDDDLDYADVLKYIGEEFGLRFTKADFSKFDGTLDNLIREVAGRLRQA